MKDFLVLAVSLVVRVVTACLNAKWLQDRGNDYLLVPRSKIQTLFGSKDDDGKP